MQRTVDTDFIGNAWIDDVTSLKGMFDYWWTHAINSDTTHDAIFKYCNFVNDSSTGICDQSMNKAFDEMGDIDIYNIYAPIFLNPDQRNASGTGSINVFDPCWQYILVSYLNDSAVQKAFHVKPTTWSLCREALRLEPRNGVASFTPSLWGTAPCDKRYACGVELKLNLFISASASTFSSVALIAKLQGQWYGPLNFNGTDHGDTDGRVPVTSSRYSINTLNLPIETAWRPWYLNKEVGGYLEAYKGLLLITVRGAGHTVPSYQPQRALTLFSSFLGGILPPPS
ncbi:hypothetical protein L6452_27936 [Arctium lappa]|uniref:Uncharacterized protein n=1 Tax=Arctium lappa TaxID=4217 RepID=A0ACB8ZW52_ARCLA|nr:hypothetical protein L6452_27936 [Arctium lappa]